jgi:hypothetical protein
MKYLPADDFAAHGNQTAFSEEVSLQESYI